MAEWEAILARYDDPGVPSVLLPNLILGRNMMPELLQEDCTAAKIASERLAPLAAETVERASQLEAFAADRTAHETKRLAAERSRGARS